MRQSKKTKPARSRSISPKSIPPEQILERLRSLKSAFNNKSYPITYKMFTIIIEYLQGNNDPLATIKEYTDNIHGFIETISELYKYASSKGLKPTKMK